MNIWAYLWIYGLKFCTVCFYCMQSWGLSKYIKLNCRTLAFNSCKTFFSKKRFRTSPPTSFSAWYLKQSIFHFTFYQLTKFHCLVAFTLQDIGQYVYCRLWRHKFWNLPYNSNQAVFSTWLRVMTKI